MKNIYLIFYFLFCSIVLLQAQSPITVEAESGTLGNQFRKVDTLGVSAITVKTDLTYSDYPGSNNRVASYMVKFAEAGTYDLYARILVGSGSYDDDSYFYGNGLGSKGATAVMDWIRANGLAGVGYTASTSVVDGGGGAQSNVWKWINMSQYTGDETPVSFVVSKAGTYLVQIAARENGLYFDKFVFGKSGLYYTVADLNNGTPGSVDNPVDKPLGDPLAKNSSKFLGCAWDYVQAPYFAGYWNQLTPGNAGKWGSVENVRGTMDWTVLDSAYSVARKYGMKFKEHTLIWGSQQPSWIGSLDSASQRQEIEEWFAALSNRYDDFEYIDVVNEPIHNAPNGMYSWGATSPNVNYADALGGAGETGWDWILTSFRLARQYFPNSKLILNEYSVINDASTTKKFIEIINLLKAENLIDGIGEQAHAFTTKGTSLDLMKKNLDALAETEIPIYLTEFDVDGLSDFEQLREYQRIFPLFWEHPAIEGITLWGYRYGVWRNDEGAYLINEDGTERLALSWLKAYVNDSLVGVDSIAVAAADGSESIQFIGETLEMKASVFPGNATIKNVTWSVEPASLASIDSLGVLTALAPGTVTVTATAWDGSGTLGTAQIEIEDNSKNIDQNFYIYLCFGQSNMEGQGAIEACDKVANPRVKVMQGVKCSNLRREYAQWYEAIPPLTRCYTRLSPADYFGRTMAKYMPDSVTIGIINVSVAGCDIKLFDKNGYADYATGVESWMSSIINEYGGNPYQRLIDLARIAQRDGVIKGILMHQGETNTGQQTWPAQVEKIIANIHSDLKLKERIPVLVGEVLYANQGGGCAAHNSVVAKVPGVVKNSYVVSAKDLPGQDNAHFSSVGYREFGARYAKKMLDILGVDYTCYPSEVISYVKTDSEWKIADTVTVQLGSLVHLKVVSGDKGSCTWSGDNLTNTTADSIFFIANADSEVVANFTNECGTVTTVRFNVKVINRVSVEVYSTSQGLNLEKLGQNAVVTVYTPLGQILGHACVSGSACLPLSRKGLLIVKIEQNGKIYYEKVIAR